MPYRAELKRPDLKGQFPCSVCGKIFCHSSSLSRHRMQAHFKSYTCTQCNQEISSNETLRSHMFRIHSISRMFMCRCCNWAFPDKTSLHIHMQSMLRTGTPGDVAVLARSSTEDGPSDMPETSSFTPEHLHQKLLGNNNVSKTLNNNLSSIFPNALKQDNILNFMQKDHVLGNLDVSSQWLSAWLANNPFAPHLGLGLATPGSKNSDSHDDEDMKEDNESEMDDVLEIETTEDDLKDEDLATQSLRLTVVPAEEEKSDARGSHKRKSAHPVHMIKTAVTEKSPESLNVTLDEKESCVAEQLSPTVSDSHTSGTSSHRGESPRKCFDCQVTKGQLLLAEAKTKQYEAEIHKLKEEIQDLQKEKTVEKAEFILPTATAPPLPLFPPVSSQSLFMQNLQNPAMKMLFHNMLANLNRQPC